MNNNNKNNYLKEIEINKLKRALNNYGNKIKFINEQYKQFVLRHQREKNNLLNQIKNLENIIEKNKTNKINNNKNGNILRNDLNKFNNFKAGININNNGYYTTDINWKKMPIREREREKEKEVEKEKMYRLGNGYSHVLKMVGFDNHGNVSLNPNSNKDLNFLFPGNYENNKIKESNDLQIKKPNYQERIQSAHSKEPKEKIYDYIKTKK